MPVLGYSGFHTCLAMKLSVTEAIRYGLSSELSWLMAGDPCPYCSEISLSSHICDEVQSNEGFFSRQHLKLCVSCGWWLIESYSLPSEDSSHGERTNHVGIFAKLLEFSDGLTNAPLEAIRAHIVKNKRTFEGLSSRAFEKIAASVISDYFDCDVVLTGHSKDRGVDMYSVISDKPWAFQFKRRLTGKPEGIEKVREFLGALVENRTPNGLFLTTAPKFTQGALSLSNSLQTMDAGYKIELVDGESFKSMFDLTFKKGNQTWAKFWNGNVDSVYSEISEFGLSYPTKA